LWNKTSSPSFSKNTYTANPNPTYLSRYSLSNNKPATLSYASVKCAASMMAKSTFLLNAKNDRATESQDLGLEQKNQGEDPGQ
jgi:hypothetical protein